MQTFNCSPARLANGQASCLNNPKHFRGNMNMRRILVTSALPYANGHIHLGHLVEYIQTDIWVRFQKLRGRRCVYICADDTHGTAIMIRARQEGIREEELIADMQAGPPGRLRRLSTSSSTTTAAPTARRTGEFCARNLGRPAQGGAGRASRRSRSFTTRGRHVPGRPVRQGHLPQVQIARSIRRQLRQVRRALQPDRPDRPGEHAFRQPSRRFARPTTCSSTSRRLHGFLEEWTQSGEHLQPEMANYLTGHFLGEPLHDWDVSRPAPYFGFEIPDSPGNYWYVWFDAPIGYIASTQTVVRSARREVRRLVAQRRDRDPSLHRQGHHLLPHAVLAGDAQDGRLQPARRRSTSTAS